MSQLVLQPLQAELAAVPLPPVDVFVARATANRLDAPQAPIGTQSGLDMAPEVLEAVVVCVCVGGGGAEKANHQAAWL
jgi:hypothetical protein